MHRFLLFCSYFACILTSISNANADGPFDFGALRLTYPQIVSLELGVLGEISHSDNMSTTTKSGLILAIEPGIGGTKVKAGFGTLSSCSATGIPTPSIRVVATYLFQYLDVGDYEKGASYFGGELIFGGGLYSLSVGLLAGGENEDILLTVGLGFGN